MSEESLFRNFKLWLTEALKAESFVPPSTQLQEEAAEYWQSTGTTEQNTHIGSRIKQIWNAQRHLNHTDDELQRAAVNALSVVAPTPTALHEILDKRLADRKAAIETLCGHLSQLAQIQEHRGLNGHTETLEAYLQKRLLSAQEDMETTRELFGISQMFLKVDWNETDLEQLRGLAQQIRDLLSLKGNTLPSAASVASSATKRKHGNDDSDKASQRRLRLTKEPNAQQDVSAEAGAPHITPSQRQPGSAANHASQNANPLSQHGPAQFPRPPDGNPGMYAKRLFDYEDQFTLSYRTWCCRQLDIAKHQTMAELEPLACYLFEMYDRTYRDHDWENEEDVPRGPFNMNRVERDIPNTRRLLRLVKNHKPCRDYIDRHLEKYGNQVAPDAENRAYELIPWVLRKGLNHDWDEEQDYYQLPRPTVEETANIELAGLQMPGVWSYLETVGQGGNGRALLFAKYDDAGRIVQRLVAKECFYGVCWNHRDYWRGRPSERVPYEAWLHSRLPQHKHLVDYLGYGTFKQLRMVRLYSAFAELGDLHSLYANHKKPFLGSNGANLQAHIPTNAILFLFEAMAAGACLMAYGAVPDDDGKWPGYDGEGAYPEVHWPHNIVHRDIKASNYFLASPPDSAIWPQLPILKLADFGNGIDSLDRYYQRYPDHVYGGGTPGWTAPEQKLQEDHDQRRPVGPATNIFQTGLVMLQLMSLSDTAKDPTFDSSLSSIFPRQGYQEVYFKDIVTLAESCCKSHPALRPKPKELYMRIRKLAMEYPSGDHQIPYQFQKIPATQVLRTQPDKYASWTV